MKIDFVITWVDDSDEEWRKKRNKYISQEKNGSITYDAREIRYRDWGLLKYWFRAVERYAPWVNKVFFVTDKQVPDWLDVHYDKLVVVNHEDFIPEKYLPTFSSHAIELNLHRIDELSECFVYFNDDTFLTNYVKPSDFFIAGKPRALGVMNVKTFNIADTMGFSQIVDTAVVNKYFSKNEVIKNNFFKWFSLKYGRLMIRNILLMPWREFPDFYLNHLPTNLKKSTYVEVWDKETELLQSASLHKFRDYTDVNQWLILFWQICKGDFCIQDVNIGKAFCIQDDNSINEICNIIKFRKYKMICIGEGNDIRVVENGSIKICEYFNKCLPEKSKFEV